MQWIILRVAYFDRQNQSVLTECISPVIQHAQQSGTFQRCFASRHWLYGPHIDIYFAYQQPKAAEQQLQQYEQQIAGWLAQNPSRMSLDVAQYLAQSAKLGEAELIAGPYGPLLTDNSVSRVAYQPDVELLRGPAMVQMKEDYCHQMMPIAIDLLQLKQQDKHAFLLKLAEMLAIVAHTFAFDGIKRGHLSLRSHLEFFLANHDPQGKLRQHYQQQDQHFASAMDNALQRVHQQFSALTFYQQLDPLLAAWCQLVHRLKGQACDVVLNNYQQLADPSHFDDVANNRVALDLQGQPYFQQGAFFELMYKQGADNILTSRQFMIYRTMVNQFYYSFLLLGVSPLEKHLLCALVANATERFYQISWQQLLSGTTVGGQHATAAA